MCVTDMQKDYLSAYMDCSAAVETEEQGVFAIQWGEYGAEADCPCRNIWTDPICIGNVKYRPRRQTIEYVVFTVND